MNFYLVLLPWNRVLALEVKTLASKKLNESDFLASLFVEI
jgi:hypothetical protein